MTIFSHLFSFTKSRAEIFLSAAVDTLCSGCVHSNNCGAQKYSWYFPLKHRSCLSAVSQQKINDLCYDQCLVKSVKPKQ